MSLKMNKLRAKGHVAGAPEPQNQQGTVATKEEWEEWRPAEVKARNVEGTEPQLQKIRKKGHGKPRRLFQG